MPVFNAAAFVQTSIKSILKQSFTGFEFLIIDDGSTDNTVAMVESFTDKRIRLIKNKNNMGVAWTLNRGLDLARGKYVVRMDADDICYRKRLLKQFQFMESNSHVGVAGSWVKYFGDQPPVIDRTPSGPEVVKAYMLFDNPIYHPSVIIRKSLLDLNNLRYHSKYSRSEDYELWIRAAEFLSLDNLQEPLLKFRCHNASVTSTDAQTMQDQACELLRRGLNKFNIDVTDEELHFHYIVSKGYRLESAELLRNAESWLQRLVDRNDHLKIYSQTAFRETVGIIWFRLCYHSAQLGMIAWRMSRSTTLGRSFDPPVASKVLFMLSVLKNSFFPLREGLAEGSMKL